MEDLREGVLCSARQKSEVPRLWFVIVKKKLFSLNKSAKLQVAWEISCYRPVSRLQSAHSLYYHETFSAESYEAGAELLLWKACDFLSVHLAGIEKQDSCPVRHTHST